MSIHLIFLYHELPSTFKGLHGKVFCITKVKINIPWRTNIIKELMFEVNSPIYLNNEPSLAVSIIFLF